MYKRQDGGKTHYAIVNVTLGLNTKAKDLSLIHIYPITNRGMSL